MKELNGNILLIGDVHEKRNEYLSLIKDADCSIQLGDFGFKSMHDSHKYDERHFILFGNHDYWPYINREYSLGTGSRLLLNGERTYAVSGAFSIDRHSRTEGVDWFKEEEHSLAECDRILNDYDEWRPKIMLSHDCPISIGKAAFNIYDKSRTNLLLQALLDIHQPLLWIFGHHHRSVSLRQEGTTFRCLKELETEYIKEDTVWRI